MVEISCTVEHGSIPPANPKGIERICVYIEAVAPHSLNSKAGCGFLIKVENQTVYYSLERLPNNTNYVYCLYVALQDAIATLIQADRLSDQITVYSDSKILIFTMDRRYEPPAHPEIRRLWFECTRLAAPFFNVKYIWANKTETREVTQLIADYVLNGVKAAV